MSRRAKTMLQKGDLCQKDCRCRCYRLCQMRLEISWGRAASSGKGKCLVDVSAIDRPAAMAAWIDTMSKKLNGVKWFPQKRGAAAVCPPCAKVDTSETAVAWDSETGQRKQDAVTSIHQSSCGQNYPRHCPPSQHVVSTSTTNPRCIIHVGDSLGSTRTRWKRNFHVSW